MAEQGAFGGPALRLSYCHAVTCHLGSFSVADSATETMGQRLRGVTCRRYLRHSTFRLVRQLRNGAQCPDARCAIITAWL